MKDLMLKVTIFYGRSNRRSKKKHPSNKKRGGVCTCYKEHIPIIKRDDLCTLKERLVTEIIVDKKSFFRVCIDHQVRLKISLRTFDLNLLLANVNNVIATLSMITRDFNAK